MEYERAQNRKVEKELKKVSSALEEELSISEKQKQVALLLIRERRSLAEQLTQERRRCALLERLMRDEKAKMKKLADNLIAESAKASKVRNGKGKMQTKFCTGFRGSDHFAGRILKWSLFVMLKCHVLNC